MEKIELSDFTLEAFDYENYNHRNIAVILDNDPDFHDYVGEMKYLVENVRMKREYEVYVIKNQDIYIGIISLITLINKPYLTIGIIPEMQRRYYGYNVLKEYIEFLFDNYPNYESIYASINPNNIKSVNNMLKLGFVSTSSTNYQKRR